MGANFLAPVNAVRRAAEAVIKSVVTVVQAFIQIPGVAGKASVRTGVEIIVADGTADRCVSSGFMR